MKRRKKTLAAATALAAASVLGVPANAAGLLEEILGQESGISLPSRNLVSAGAGKIADVSGNLVLKNIQNATPSTVGPSTSSSTYAVIPEMTLTFTTKGNNVLLVFAASLDYATVTGSQFAKLAIFKDGSQLTNDIEFGFSQTGTASLEAAITITFIDSPTAASHTYDVRWKLSLGAGPVSSLNKGRSFQAVELG